MLDPQFGRYATNVQTEPFGILNVSWDGNISTFSPELLGASDPRFGTFLFGSVAGGSLAGIAASPKLQRVAREIRRGVTRCRQVCPYFSFCRGGAPANKLAETGRFDATVTGFCTVTQMIVAETVLRGLEQDLTVARAS